MELPEIYPLKQDFEIRSNEVVNRKHIHYVRFSIISVSLRSRWAGEYKRILELLPYAEDTC
jgi:hypothetical protein